MLLGALSYQPPQPALVDIPYTTFGVHFNGLTWLTRGAALTGWGTPNKFTAALWSKLSVCNDGIFSDANFFTQGTTADNGNKYVNVNVASTYFDSYGLGQIISAGWQCLLISLDVSVAGASVQRLYINDIDKLEAADSSEGFTTTIAAGSNFFFGQDGFGVKITGDIADFRLWLGGNADFSQVNTRRRFIRSNGKPAQPSLATDLLGTPIVSFISTGNTASFAANGGSGGAFTTTGSLSMAGTSPTD